MRILVPGNTIPLKPDRWYLKVKSRCPKCKCVFEIEDGDTVELASEVTALTKTEAVYVYCPECKTKLSVVEPTEPVFPSNITVSESIFGEVFGEGGIFADLFGGAFKKKK